MRRAIVGLLVLLALLVVADAQMAPALGQMPLEIRKPESPPESKLGRPVVSPAPQSEDAVREESAASPTSSALHATAGRSASRLRSSRDVRTSGTTSRAPFSRGTSGGRSRADRLTQQELLGGGQAGAEPHGHAEVLQRHLDSREPAEQVEVVEAPEMADAEHLATDRAQPDAEGQVEPSMGVADELVGVEARWHHDRGERVRVFGGIPAADRDPERAHRAPARLGEPRVAGEDVV